MAETNKITLTLEPKKEETPVVEEEKIVVPIEISDKDLTEEEKKMVEEFSKTIDILLRLFNAIHKHFEFCLLICGFLFYFCTSV